MGLVPTLKKSLKPDNIHYIEIYLFDCDNKGQDHSDVIVLFETVTFLLYIYMQNLKGMDLET